MSGTPDKKEFEKFSGFGFDELVDMNLGTRDGCDHFYHKSSDTVYSWDFINGAPHWEKPGSEKTHKLKRRWDQVRREIPDEDKFKEFSGCKFSDLLKMNIYEYEMKHYYHGPTDTVYSWNFTDNPRWIKHDSEETKELKQRMNNS